MFPVFKWSVFRSPMYLHFSGIARSNGTANSSVITSSSLTSSSGQKRKRETIDNEDLAVKQEIAEEFTAKQASFGSNKSSGQRSDQGCGHGSGHGSYHGSGSSRHGSGASPHGSGQGSKQGSTYGSDETSSKKVQQYEESNSGIKQG